MHIQRKGSKDKSTSDIQQQGRKSVALQRAGAASLRLNWKVAAYDLQRLVHLKEARVEAF